MSSKILTEMMITDEERAVIEVLRKMLWGSVEIRVRKGEIKTITKTVETYAFDRDANNE